MGWEGKETLKNNSGKIIELRKQTNYYNQHKVETQVHPQVERERESKKTVWA